MEPEVVFVTTRRRDLRLGASPLSTNSTRNPVKSVGRFIACCLHRNGSVTSPSDACDISGRTPLVSPQVVIRCRATRSSNPRAATTRDLRALYQPSLRTVARLASRRWLFGMRGNASRRIYEPIAGCSVIERDACAPA